MTVTATNQRAGDGAEVRAGEEGDHEFSVFDLLTVLALKKRFILLVSLAGAFVLGAFSFAIQPSFTANVTLLPPQQGGSSGAAALAQLGGLSVLGQGGLGLKNPVDMYVSMMEGDNVLDSMIQRFDLSKEYKTRHQFETRKQLQINVAIEANPKDGLIRLRFTDRNPARAAELANGYVDEFRKLSANLAITEAAQRRLFFEQQLEQQKNKLGAAEEDLKQTQQATGVVALDSQARALIQSTSTLRAQVAAKQVQVEGMRTYAGPGNTDLILAEKELAGLRAELARMGGSGGDLNVSTKLPQASLDYVRKEREVKYDETLFEILARQYESARLDEAKEGAPIQVVDPAIPPDHKSGPKRLYYVLGGLFGGVFFAMLYVLFQAALARNIRLAERYRTFKRALLSL